MIEMFRNIFVYLCLYFNTIKTFTHRFQIVHNISRPFYNTLGVSSSNYTIKKRIPSDFWQLQYIVIESNRSFIILYLWVEIICEKSCFFLQTIMNLR